MTTRERRRPPGPKGKPLLGSLADFRRDLTGTLMNGWRTAGDIVAFQVVGDTYYLVVHPDHVDHILRTNYDNYAKAPLQESLWRRLVGQGLVASKGEVWARQRRVMEPSFSKERAATLGNVITDATEEMLARWDQYAAARGSMELRHEMTRLTLGIVGQTMFSTDIRSEVDGVGVAIDEWLSNVKKRMRSPFDIPERVPLPSIRRFVAAREQVDRFADRLAAGHRAPGDDLLDALMEAGNGARMDERQIRDEIKMSFAAAQATMTSALTWLWYLLSLHPDVVEELRSEHAQVLGGRTPTTDDLERLRYTWQVVEESLRVFPPFWVVLRVALEDDEIGGYHIRAGKTIFVSSYITHRHPEFWENPEAFEPDRFAPERTRDWHRFQYFPFGGGPRKCIGNELAMTAMQLIVATVVPRYDVAMVPGFRVVPDFGLSLVPRDGVKVTVERHRS